MIKFTNNIKASYIFNVVALMIIIISIFVYANFTETKKDITQTYDSSTQNYVKDFTNNIKDLLLKRTKQKIYESLETNVELRSSIEDDLALFITDRYKYIYLLDKEEINSNKYRFLLDGSKDIDDKSEFNEIYEPLEIEKFNTVYNSKKSMFFTHKNIESLWMTYLTPVVIDNKVEAIIVVDFSIEDFKIINNALNNFDTSFAILVVFLVFVFILIIRFSFLDKKRELQKERAYKALKSTTQELKDETIKVTNLNNTLEQRVDKELRKNKLQNEQLIQQSRLAQMGEMISMIAHQWRQPLNAISLTSNNLMFKCMMQDMEKSYFETELSLIEEYALHLSKTIDDFRDFFKIDKEKELISLDEVTENTLNIIKVSIETKNIAMQINLNATTKFYTYHSELKQVILNIIKNAEDALLDTDTKKPIISIESYQNDENTSSILVIKDNAGGIPADIIESIFDPYFSTKKEREGTGLGLYMSRTIINEHCAGQLSVTNDENGAVFIIELAHNT